MIDYILVRSDRKTLSLYIRDGKLEARAPLRMSKKEIDRFIISKEEWINEKLAKSTEQTAKRNNFSLTYGDKVRYRGEKYPIIAKPGNRIGFDDDGFYMPPDLSGDYIKRYCIEIYRLLARKYLMEITPEFAKKMSVSPAAIKINNANTRWGSCSAKNSLNFSWKIIMADDDVINYIVVHELAHIKELNHSAKFWEIVKSVIPNYKEKQKSLKKLQTQLLGESW